MSRSLIVGSCSCSNQGTIADLLRCAPCPPPMILYEEFRDHALSRSLLLKEVCIIARRCDINGTDFVNDCPHFTPDCPSTTSHTFLTGDQSDIVLPIVWVIVSIFGVISLIILIFIRARKRKEIKGIYQSCIKKQYRNRKTITGKRSDPKSKKETTFIFHKESVDEKTVHMHPRESTTDAEETSSLMHTVTEEKYYLAPEGIKEIKVTDVDDKTAHIHDARVYDKGTKPAPLAINIEEEIKPISKEISDKSSTDQFELPEPAGMFLKKHLKSVPQDNSETCPHEHIRTSVQIHPGTSFKDPDDNSITYADSDSFHSAESLSDMDK